MKPEIRIHIATLGYNSERIYVPAINKKAEVVYLLKYPEEKDKKALKALKEIRIA